MDNNEKILKYKMLLENEAAKNDIMEQKVQILKAEKEKLEQQIAVLNKANINVEPTNNTEAEFGDMQYIIIANKLQELFERSQSNKDDELLDFVKMGLNLNNSEAAIFKKFIGYYESYIRTDYIEFCKQYSQIYIYGAGIKAKRCANALSSNGISFEGFVVSDKKNNANVYLQHKVHSIKRVPYKDKNVGILIALNEQNAQQVYPILRELKIRNFCYFK